MTPGKEEAANVASILLTIIALVVGVFYSVFAISINAGRIGKLQSPEAQTQEQLGKIAIDPHASNVDALLENLKKLSADRDSLLDQIRYGQSEFWSLPFLHCIFPLDPNCFHRNASETNNLYLAMASGVLGACLFLFFRFRDQAIGKKLEASGSIVYVVCLISSGIVVGLLMVYLLRGTKGALLTPVANVVQVENPYGIAFTCMAAAFFSDRIISWLSNSLILFPGRPQPPATGA